MAIEGFTRVLAVNTGSSSMKFGQYRMGSSEETELSGSLSGIGSSNASFGVQNGEGTVLIEERSRLPNHEAAADRLFEWLRREGALKDLHVVGHRIVHGGSRYREPHVLTADVMEYLRGLVKYAPDHLPQELKVIDLIADRLPGRTQIVCFDTSFHTSMPQCARIYGLPRSLIDKGVIRYGFHGLSYEYIVSQLRIETDDDIDRQRIIVAHLGSGASMAAIDGGRGIDTTMGFSPTGGLVMSTRCGDLDPGVMLYLLMEEKLNPGVLSDVLNKQAGLLGISDVTSDMRELLERDNDPKAADAVELFCYEAKKFLGGLAAALGGLDILVFTGGIGENAPEIRERICSGMEFLGIWLDSASNHRNASVISGRKWRVCVRVMRTNENLMIARHAKNCLERSCKGHR